MFLNFQPRYRLLVIAWLQYQQHELATTAGGGRMRCTMLSEEHSYVPKFSAPLQVVGDCLAAVPSARTRNNGGRWLHAVDANLRIAVVGVLKVVFEA